MQTISVALGVMHWHAAFICVGLVAAEDRVMTVHNKLLVWCNERNILELKTRRLLACLQE